MPNAVHRASQATKFGIWKRWSWNALEVERVGGETLEVGRRTLEVGLSS